MARLDIKIGDQSKEESSQLHHVALVTTLGAIYTFPDMTKKMFRELLYQLNSRTEKVVVRNISDVTLVIPFRIIDRLLLCENSVDLPSDGAAPESLVWGRS